MHTFANHVVDEEDAVSNAVILSVAAVKSVDVAFASTSVRRVDNVPACTADPIAPIAPRPMPRIVWYAR